MKLTNAIIIGVVVYLTFYFGEKGIHFAYFYFTHDFSTSNLLMMKSSFLFSFAILLGGGIAGYLSNKGLLSGFIVGCIASSIVLIIQQITGANPLMQEFTPAILFDEVFLNACICAAAGATGELIRYKSRQQS